MTTIIFLRNKPPRPPLADQYYTLQNGNDQKRKASTQKKIMKKKSDRHILIKQGDTVWLINLQK